MSFRIAPLTSTAEVRQSLATLLVETVAHGGSVGFMHPLPLSDAEAFWGKVLASAERGERIVLGAFESEALVGAVSLILDTPPNQPHRAEIAKMMTRVAHRGRGAARALLVEAERLARANGRSLLVLDTAQEDGAAGLYEKMGYQLTGLIPDYALKPRGGLTGTYVYWKRLT